MRKTVNLQVLNQNREEYRQSQRAPNGLAYDKIVVGAAAFRSEANGTTSKETVRILLLKRAADESHFPNVFELPGGKVDAEDLSIGHALERELREETGLAITEIIGELDPMFYTTEKRNMLQNGQESRIVSTAKQLNYIVRLSDGDVVTDPKEHSTSKWTTIDELGPMDITDAMRVVVNNAFNWFGYYIDQDAR